MDCVGARNIAAMAAVPSFSWRSRTRRLSGRRSTRRSYRYHSCLPTIRAGASGGKDSCVVIKEGFGDEEDNVKAGGSELLVVQMQQTKSMEKQAKIADKVIL
ncbi:lycopene epsilon cyclase, chloroplastic-like [Macadamia integrifolia]|uniref:lycopene epsilon cyclase, chloroplastic-like n=1 Tax=Macadamia integrifolia TaxID=60698 RepID=UPI001C4F0D2B|nr:lycopene epsilon cyclase, chloroplastic-like [Macadamia integrifolia]